MTWELETPDAQSFGAEAWEREAAKCRAEGIDPPNRERFLTRSRDAGWEPFEPLHESLVEYVAARHQLENPVDWQDRSPPVRWPFGRWGFVRHERRVVRFLRQAESRSLKEFRARA